MLGRSWRCCAGCHRPGGGGDDNDDTSVEDQDMPYANADTLYRDWRWAEGGEDDVDDGGNNEHINERVRGLCWEDTGDRQWRNTQCDGCNNDEDEEGG